MKYNEFLGLSKRRYSEMDFLLWQLKKREEIKEKENKNKGGIEK